MPSPALPAGPLGAGLHGPVAVPSQAAKRPGLLFGEAWTRALGDLCVHGINLNEIRHNVINGWLGKVFTKHLERRRKTGSG